MGTNAGHIQEEGDTLSFFPDSERGGKLRKKFQICRECWKAHNFDHFTIMAVIFMCCGLANHTQGLTEAHPTTAVITHYRCAHRHPYNRRPVGAFTVTLHCSNSLKTHSRIEFGRCSCLKGFLGQHKDIKKSVWQLLKFSVVLLGFLNFFFLSVKAEAGR